MKALVLVDGDAVATFGREGEGFFFFFKWEGGVLLERCWLGLLLLVRGREISW